MSGPSLLIRPPIDPSRPQLHDGPCFRVYMLGPSWIEWDGESLTIKRRQARALLYCLAEKLQPVPREELCFGFWPDADEAVGRRHFSHLLSHLRDELPIADMLSTSNEMVGLDPRAVWSDAAAFRAACAVPETQQTHTLPSALPLYRGPLLSGFSLPDSPEFDEWVRQQRAAYQRMYLDALATLMKGEADRANYTQAVRYGREYVKVDRLAEGIHRRLMVLHAMQGDRPAALQQYRDCAAALQRELGVAPLPETSAVYQAIMQNDLTKLTT